MLCTSLVSLTILDVDKEQKPYGLLSCGENNRISIFQPQIITLFINIPLLKDVVKCLTIKRERVKEKEKIRTLIL